MRGIFGAVVFPEMNVFSQSSEKINVRFTHDKFENSHNHFWCIKQKKYLYFLAMITIYVERNAVYLFRITLSREIRSCRIHIKSVTVLHYATHL